MIQRIQSIYLLVAAVALFALMGFSFFQTSESTEVAALADGDFDVHDHVALLAIALVAGAVLLLDIFLFNNRKLQMRIAQVGLLLVIALVAVMGLLLWQAIQAAAVAVSPSVGIAMPVVAIVCTWLARQRIQKDESLVQSAYNRLR